jgi:hypothetical protein
VCEARGSMRQPPPSAPQACPALEPPLP